MKERIKQFFVRWWIWRWISIRIQSSIFCFYENWLFHIQWQHQLHRTDLHNWTEMRQQTIWRTATNWLWCVFFFIIFGSSIDFGCSIYRHRCYSRLRVIVIHLFIFFFFSPRCCCVSFFSLSINLFVSVAFHCWAWHKK